MKLSLKGYAWLIPAKIKNLDQCPIYPLWNRKVTLDVVRCESPLRAYELRLPGKLNF